MSYFIFNGKMYLENIPVIGPDNRGLRYGDGIFETIKIAQGQIVFPEEHFKRLWNGLQVLQFNIPRHFTPSNLQGQIYSLVKKNSLEKLTRVRLNVFRGDGGLYDTINHFPNYIIQALPMPAEQEQLNNNGLVLGIYADGKKSCDIFSNLKHNNYLLHCMAALQAKKEKWNDALIINSKGKICEATIANIFIVKGKKIFTPCLSEGCVAGIMRNFLINTLKKEGFYCEEKSISIEVLLNADEVFLTNTVYNMQWVKTIGNKDYNNILTQKIYATLFNSVSGRQQKIKY